MSWQNHRWQIPLESMPDIGYMGENVHGRSKPVESWHNARFWGLHLYRYEATLLINGEEFPVRPGFAGIVPPDVHREYHFYGPSVHAYAHFTFPEAKSGEATAAIPTMQDLGEKFDAIYAMLLAAASRYTIYRVRANVQLWAMLWQLSEVPKNHLENMKHLHPAVQKVSAVIEQNLAEPLNVKELARKVDLTGAHLSRLFKCDFGVTVSTFIRRRRMERANQLIQYSALPIKSIAVAVGIADLHQFNKIIHRELGTSPRALRRPK